MFNFILFASIFLTPAVATREVICALGSDISSYNPNADERPSSDAMQLARQVNTALASSCSPNCPALAVFRNSTAPKAMMIVDSGQAKIVYSPQFFSAAYEKYGDGAIIAIIAHMAGHAIDETSPAAWMKKDWGQELRADAWVGCTFARVNLSLSALEAALTAILRYPPASPPSWPSRIQALRLGYIHCGGNVSKFDIRASRIKMK